MDNMNKGLEGLGVINTNNANATITPSNMNVNTNTSGVNSDNRKFDNNSDRFNTIDEYFNYLYEYMNNTGILRVSQADDFSFLFYAQFIAFDNSTSVNNGFCIFACPSLENVQSIISLLQNSFVTNLPNRRVAIGYFNYDNNIKNMAKQVGLELMGYNDILDLNNAIDLADKKMPYMNFDGSSFESMLAKQLHEKYKQTATGDMGQQFSGEMSGIGVGLEAAFTEGFNQLKQSLFGLGKDLGLVKSQNQQPQQMMENQGMMNQQTPISLTKEQTPVQERSVVSLGKQDNPNLNLEMNIAQSTVNIHKQEHNLEMNTTEPLEIPVQQNVNTEVHHVVENAFIDDSTFVIDDANSHNNGISLKK